MLPRILFDIIGILLCIIAPWWAALVFGVIGAGLFPWYIEIIFFGMLFDVIYGNIGGFHFKHTIIFLVPLVVIEFIKPRIRL